MTVFDDCYDCHWRMAAGMKRIDGFSGVVVDEWCGAGRPEFNNDYATEPCPARLEIVELEINSIDQPDAFDSVKDDGSRELGVECRLWMHTHMPNTDVKVESADIVHDGKQWIRFREAVLRFEYPKHAVLFKLRWF